jgi:hypothetical protein
MLVRQALRHSTPQTCRHFHGHTKGNDILKELEKRKRQSAKKIFKGFAFVQEGQVPVPSEPPHGPDTQENSPHKPEEKTEKRQAEETGSPREVPHKKAHHKLKNKHKHKHKHTTPLKHHSDSGILYRHPHVPRLWKQDFSEFSTEDLKKSGYTQLILEDPTPVHQGPLLIPFSFFSVQFFF